MIDTAAMVQAAGEINAIQEEIGVVLQRADSQWRYDLVALRRKLQLAIAAVSKLAGTLSRDDADDRAMRNAFENMRNKVALHQANWPAVKADPDDPEYGRSMQDLRLASRHFIRLIDELPKRTTIQP